MAHICFFDATDIDNTQLSESLQNTDHYWHFIPEKISLENLDPDTEVISVFVSSTVTREMIEALPKLRLIACRSTGFNNIDMQAAAEHDVTVVNVPTYGDATVAEYAFTLLLAITRKLPQTLDVEEKEFRLSTLTGYDLRGKTIGVIGTGHIGQRTIEISNGFGMKTIAYDAFPKQELETKIGFKYVSLDDLISMSDVISLHLPYLPSTHHILNAERLKCMKKGAILINTARGELVDTGALIELLDNGHLGGAGLDVIEGEVLLNYAEEVVLLRKEKVPSELLKHSVELSILQKMKNVIITPHNAFNTIEAVQRINTTTAKNIIEFWYGSTPNLVKPTPPKRGKLILARHAESEWNATGQWTGITDVHLSEKGFHEASQLGQELNKININVDIAYCSEQIRTRETLEGMLDASQQFNVDIIRNGALNERDYGDYTGKNKWEIKELIGEDAWNAIRRGWDVPVPSGETLKMVYERVVPFYKETIVPLLGRGKNVLIVAHGNSLRALIKYIESINDEDVESLQMLFGEIIVYETSEEGVQTEKKLFKIDTTPPPA